MRPSVFDILFIASSSWLDIHLTLQLVSHGEVGVCDINKELFSDVENKRFVLHDSKGFEPADEGNFDTVMKFLGDREAEENIKDQVHAVW